MRQNPTVVEAVDWPVSELCHRQLAAHVDEFNSDSRAAAPRLCCHKPGGVAGMAAAGCITIARDHAAPGAQHIDFRGGCERLLLEGAPGSEGAVRQAIAASADAYPGSGVGFNPEGLLSHGP